MSAVGRRRYDQSSQTYGSVPERPKGADCKSAGIAYVGSNPARPTTKRPIAIAIGRLCFFNEVAVKEQTQSPHQRVGDWVHFRWFCPPTVKVCHRGVAMASVFIESLLIVLKISRLPFHNYVCQILSLKKNLISASYGAAADAIASVNRPGPVGGRLVLEVIGQSSRKVINDTGYIVTS